MQQEHRTHFKRTQIIAIVVILAFGILLAAGLWLYLDRQERKRVEAEQRERGAQCSFYQKLQEGLKVRILIVGDSIGATAGASSDEARWTNLLLDAIQDKYGVKVSMTNVSMGGNASYAGYMRTMLLDDGMTAEQHRMQPEGPYFHDYDLAVVCYGQNDGEEDFPLYYESILRAIRQKYTKCSIISILESSQRDYTEKMKQIQRICAHYGIPIADTIRAFADSGRPYEELATDGVHPNDEGQKLYFQTVMSVIEQNVGTEYDFTEVPVLNDDVVRFDKFLMIGTEQTITNQMHTGNLPGFTRADDTTYVIRPEELGMDRLDGIMGICHIFYSGQNNTAIYVDGQERMNQELQFDVDAGFSQSHAYVVQSDCVVEEELKVVFGTKEQADGFQGIVFSGFDGGFQ